ncbi:MAG: hypothetical protein QOG59_2939 [Solirubrobacteraceae bacterium]|nr:hypothetical protein [Solirubrobacteraceae bacterium]
MAARHYRLASHGDCKRCVQRWGVAVRVLLIGVVVTALSVAEPLAADASAARVGVVTITVVDRASVSPRTLQLVEHALTVQSNRDVRRWWHGPRVRFGPGGWRVMLEPLRRFGRHQRLLALDPAGDLGWHSTNAAGTPFAVAGVGGPLQGPGGWEDTLSHEVVEMVVDPYGVIIDSQSLFMDPCDPVQTVAYQIDGVAVSDFVTPRWFGLWRSGRFDFLRSVHGVGEWAS